MLGSETISSLRGAADTATHVMHAIDARTERLEGLITRTIGALPEPDDMNAAIRDVYSDTKTAAQLVSVAAVAVTLVSLIALGVATLALIRTGDR